MALGSRNYDVAQDVTQADPVAFLDKPDRLYHHALSVFKPLIAATVLIRVLSRARLFKMPNNFDTGVRMCVLAEITTMRR